MKRSGDQRAVTPVRIVMVLCLAAALVLLTPGTGSAAVGAFPWPKTPLCSKRVKAPLVVSAIVEERRYRASVRAGGSEVLGVSVPTFDGSGGQVSSGAPSSVADDAFGATYPRLASEVRVEATAAAVYREKGKPCRVGAVSVARLGKAGQLWRCSAKGTRRSATLRCRLLRVR